MYISFSLVNRFDPNYGTAFNLACEAKGKLTIFFASCLSMDRSIATGNKICAKRQQELRRFKHYDKLRTIQPDIDNGLPSTLTLSHLKVNMKREQLQEDRFVEVDRANRIMLQRIADIARKPGVSLEPPSGSKAPSKLKNTTRQRNLKRIINENQSIIRRIRDIQPQYDHVRWEQEYRRTRLYLKNACEYPIAHEPKTKPSALVGEPLGIPSLFTHQFPEGSSISSGPTRNSTTSSKSTMHLKLLAKDGKRFDDTFYLIEVYVAEEAVLGELLITAFSGREPNELELCMSPEEHAQWREALSGDYGQLADRVRVHRGKIFLAPL